MRKLEEKTKQQYLQIE